MNNSARRPLKTRQYQWAHKLAHCFVAHGMTPNQMSLASIPLATLGAFCYLAIDPTSPVLASTLLIIAATSVQLRLLSNMLDGLMAVEENKKTATGPLYNELPDRLCDILFLASAGVTVSLSWLGWLIAALSVLTAYIRALGASLGNEQDYCGPMAKPHRMFALTVGTLIAAFTQNILFLKLALFAILFGCLITVARRTQRLISYLEKAQ